MGRFDDCKGLQESHGGFHGMKNMIGIRGKRGIFDVKRVDGDNIYFCFCIYGGGMRKQWGNK